MVGERKMGQGESKILTGLIAVTGGLWVKVAEKLVGTSQGKKKLSYSVVHQPGNEACKQKRKRVEPKKMTVKTKQKRGK